MLAPKKPIKHFLFPNKIYLRQRLNIDCILKTLITYSFLSQFLFIHLNKKGCIERRVENSLLLRSKCVTFTIVIK